MYLKILKIRKKKDDKKQKLSPTTYPPIISGGGGGGGVSSIPSASTNGSGQSSSNTGTITPANPSPNFDINQLRTIQIKTQPIKLSYVEGEGLDLSGLVVVLTDENNKSKEVAFADFSANGISVTPTNASVLDLTKNSTRVRITKGNASAETEALTVTEKAFNPNAVRSISISTQPTKLSYIEGEALDLSGLVAVLRDENNKTKEVALADFSAYGLITSPVNGLALDLAKNGTKVRVSKGDVSVETNALSVSEKAFNPNAVNQITVSTQPSKLSYVEGEVLDLSGLVVVLRDENNKTKEVALADFSANGISVTPENNSALDLAKNGTKVRISKGNVSVETNALSVSEKAFNPNAVNQITVSTQPSKLSYVEGEVLDLSGLVVVLRDENNKTKEVALADFSAYGLTTSPANEAVLDLAKNGSKVRVSKGSVSVETEALEVTRSSSVDTRRTYQSHTNIVTTESEKFAEFKAKYGDFIDEDGYVNEQNINQDYLLNVEVVIDNGRIVSVTPTSPNITRDDEKYLRKTKKFTTALVGLDKAGVEAIRTWRTQESDELPDMVSGATITNNAIKHEVLASFERYLSDTSSSENGNENPSEVFYTLSYDANGGEGSVPSEVRLREGGETAISFSPVPSKANHRFLGWSLEPNGALTYPVGTSAHLVLNGSKILYAKWEACQKELNESTRIVVYKDRGAKERSYAFVFRLVISTDGRVRSAEITNSSAYDDDVKYLREVERKYLPALIGKTKREIDNLRIRYDKEKYSGKVHQILKGEIDRLFGVWEASQTCPVDNPPNNGNSGGATPSQGEPYRYSASGLVSESLGYEINRDYHLDLKMVIGEDGRISEASISSKDITSKDQKYLSKAVSRYMPSVLNKTKAEIEALDTRSGATATAKVAKKLILQGFAQKEANSASSGGSGAADNSSSSGANTSEKTFRKTVVMREKYDEADKSDYSVTVALTLDEKGRIKQLTLSSQGARDNDVRYFIR